MLDLLVLASALTTPVCDTANLMHRVQTVRTSLFSIQDSPDDLPIDAPPLAQQGVPELRQALSAAITGYMQCEGAGITIPGSIQSGLAAVLNAIIPLALPNNNAATPSTPTATT